MIVDVLVDVVAPEGWEHKRREGHDPADDGERNAHALFDAELGRELIGSRRDHHACHDQAAPMNTLTARPR